MRSAARIPQYEASNDHSSVIVLIAKDEPDENPVEITEVSRKKSRVSSSLEITEDIVANAVIYEEPDYNAPVAMRNNEPNMCFKCGGFGHWMRDCPIFKRERMIRREDHVTSAERWVITRISAIKIQPRCLRSKKRGKEWNKWQQPPTETATNAAVKAISPQIVLRIQANDRRTQPATDVERKATGLETVPVQRVENSDEGVQDQPVQRLAFQKEVRAISDERYLLDYKATNIRAKAPHSDRLRSIRTHKLLLITSHSSMARTMERRVFLFQV